jgi:hypothetical protein
MKKDKHGRLHGGGYPRFRPSKAQRDAVRIMAGVRMAVDEIRRVILNPCTQRPLTKAAMYRHFRREMAEGPPTLRWLIAKKYLEHLEEGREYAVRLGLKNKHGWATEGSAPPSAYVLDTGQDQKMQVTFVVPSGRPPETNPLPVIDAVPTGPADYSLPAIEPPRPRVRTETGAVYEAPRGSVFDRPDSKDWMR